MSTLNENGATSRDPRAPVTADDARRRRGRRQLLVLAAIFFVPLAVAFWLYYGPGNWRPVGGTNQGDLIAPAVPLAEVELTRPDGSRVRSSELFRGKWTMAYLGPGHCDERCRRALYLSRQSRIARRGAVLVEGAHAAVSSSAMAPGSRRRLNATKSTSATIASANHWMA